jgi:arylsulfatase
MYKDGWWACSRPDKLPWDMRLETVQKVFGEGWDPDQDVWELYYLPDDFSQANDLAAEKA